MYTLLFSSITSSRDSCCMREWTAHHIISDRVRPGRKVLSLPCGKSAHTVYNIQLSPLSPAILLSYTSGSRTTGLELLACFCCPFVPRTWLLSSCLSPWYSMRRQPVQTMLMLPVIFKLRFRIPVWPQMHSTCSKTLHKHICWGWKSTVALEKEPARSFRMIYTMQSIVHLDEKQLFIRYVLKWAMGFNAV